MYAVPARKETFGATETIIGNWLAANPGLRERIVLATKVAGPVARHALDAPGQRHDGRRHPWPPARARSSACAPR